MNRLTIDYGIDLGTTNSSIAVLQGNETKVIENNEGQKYTPSIVWIDRRDRLYVGNRAKNQLESDPENAYGEFKLQMGTSHTYRFSHSNRSMKPEELSAEIIKSLREDVRQHTGDDFTAAVITVPAAFELPQCEATIRAARLAGLEECPLVQEPVAAALAYGFQREEEKKFWLVFDIGGGTFDAAILYVNEGSIQVLNHGGDNHLGSKLVDWAIVDRLFVPALLKEYPLENFNRNNPRWKMAYAKLKLHAEEAKIQLSRYQSTQVYIDPLCTTNQDDLVLFDYELTRRDLELIMEPYLDRSINICQRVLRESQLSPDDIEKLILVGGPTQSPSIRGLLEERLRIPLEFSVDPLTVVSRGAAVFAGTQRLRQIPVAEALPGQVQIELDYKPIDNDPEPLVAGKILLDASLDAPWTVEFVETKSQWRSGAIQLDENGVFMTSLFAERGRSNEFDLILKDEVGRVIPSSPNHMSYTLGATIDAQPLIRSIGVALANNQMRIFHRKGSSLPVRHREIFQTTQEVLKGESGTFLNIPVVEGEIEDRADRNHLIGNLKVSGTNIRRTVHAGSEIEITIVIDESRRIHTIAYIPILDEEYEEILKLEKTIAAWEDLEKDAEAQQERLTKLQQKVHEIHHPPAQTLLKQIEQEQLLSEIERALQAARLDNDAADKCQARLLELKKILDEVEASILWPSLAGEAVQLINNIQYLIDSKKYEMFRTRFKLIRMNTETCLESHNPHSLPGYMDELRELQAQILAQEPEYWIDCFHYLVEQRPNIANQQIADPFFEQGYRALQTRDIPLLESAVRHLVNLLQQEEQVVSNQLKSTVMPLV